MKLEANKTIRNPRVKRQALLVQTAGKGSLVILGVTIALFLGESLGRTFFPHWAPRTGAITQLWQENSILGWSHVPNSRGPFNAFGFESFVSINSKGFRDKERSYARDLFKYRIVVLGDSVVWGYGVQDEEVFTRLMENRRADIDVINLGVSGYGTDQELLLLQQEGIRYRPDLIAVMVHENDFVTNVRRVVYLAYQKPMFEFNGDGSLVLTNTPVPKQTIWARMTSLLVRSSYLLNRTAQAYETFRSSQHTSWPPSKSDPVWELPFPRTLTEKLTVALLFEMQREAQRVGAEFIIVLSDGLGRSGQEIEDFFKSRHIRVVNMDTVFHKEDAQLLHIADGVHWSAVGHEKVAHCLLSYLNDENLLPRSFKKRKARN